MISEISTEPVGEGELAGSSVKKPRVSRQVALTRTHDGLKGSSTTKNHDVRAVDADVRAQQEVMEVKKDQLEVTPDYYKRTAMEILDANTSLEPAQKNLLSRYFSNTPEACEMYCKISDDVRALWLTETLLELRPTAASNVDNVMDVQHDDTDIFLSSSSNRSDEEDLLWTGVDPKTDVMRTVTRTTQLEASPPLEEEEPYYTSALTGYDWVMDLLDDIFVPERIHSQLGVHEHVFWELYNTLQQNGHTDSDDVTLEEQLAIFLYMCVTGISNLHAGERFQRPSETIARYFVKMLSFFSSPPFYTDNVRPTCINDHVPEYVLKNPKLYPFFKDALGAMDGTHIICIPTAEERLAEATHRWTWNITQNCLAACTFDMRFVYIYSWWNDSEANSTVDNDQHVDDLHIPPGKYYLADAGFPSCDSLLVPYREARYHVAELSRADVRPQNYQELYNMRHSSARNVVERLFGVLKARFRILVMPPRYTLDLQARLPRALAALHNFVCEYDPEELEEILEDVHCDPDPGNLKDQFSLGPSRTAERARAMELRNSIAQQMWTHYQTSEKLH